MIPKKFTIFSHSYKVKQIKKIDKHDSWGEHDPTKQTIKIKSTLNQEQKEQTFYHELMHCIFFHLSYPELDCNEALVDQIGKALHQIMTTKTQ